MGEDFVKKYSIFIVAGLAAVLLVVTYMLWSETKNIPQPEVGPGPEGPHLYGGGFKDIKKSSNQFKAGKIEPKETVEE